MHDAAAGTVSALLAAPFEDEAALIRTAQKGDQDAFERLVREYDQSVLRLAMNLLRSAKPGKSLKVRRKVAGWNPDYLNAILHGTG